MSKRSISPFEQYGEPRPVTDVGLRTHVFTVTDTLSALAEKHLGDWRLWRVIADRNKIPDPRRIEPGTALVIPRRPLEKGIYESE